MDNHIILFISVGRFYLRKIMNVTFDKNLFSDLNFGDSQVTDKQGNVVGEIDSDGGWSLYNGIKVSSGKPKKKAPKKRKKIKLI